MTAPLLASWPRINVQIAFNTGGLQTQVPYWTDVTARLQGTWTATLAGRQNELDQIQSGTASFVLDNTDGTFDPLNSAGPYFGAILPYRRIRLTATWPPSRNQLPQQLAGGAALGDAMATTGSLAIAPVTPPASGQSTAIAWTYPASIANVAIGQGTGQGFTVCDPDAVPVLGQPGQVPLQAWTFSVYLSATGAVPLAGRISWYGQNGVRIATSDGTPVTAPAPPTWTRVTVSATAPAGAIWARVEILSTSATAGSTTVYATGWQFEQAAAASAWVDPGTTAGLWSGYVERWGERWPDGTVRATIELPCVDSLAGLAKVTLQPSFQQSLQALGPSQLYALNEQAGANQFADATGHRTVRFPWAVPAGGTGASITPGAGVQGAGFIGATGPVVTITNPSPGSSTPSQGMYISAPWAGPWGPPESGGWSRVICFRTTVTPSNRLMIWNAYGPGAVGGGAVGSQSYLQLYVDSSGHFTGTINNADSSASATITVPDIFCPDGNWHIAVLQLSSDGKTFTVACDNHGYLATTAGDFHTVGCTSDTLGAVVLASGAYNMFSGDLAYAVEYGYEIGNSAAFDLANGFALGWAGESSTARAKRILAMAGLPTTLTAIDTQTIMGGANLAGTSALGALQLVAASEAGQLYADGNGAITLAGRRWRYLQTAPALTFGENTAAGEIPYTGSPRIDIDPDHIYNTIQVTNQVAPNTPQPPDAYATTPASQQAYFQSSLPRTINVADPTEAGYAAAYLAQQYAQPMPRVDAVTVDPSAYPTAWPSLLALGFGTRARLMRRPPAAPVIQLETFVEQIEWKGNDQGQLALTLQQAPAAPYSGWLIAAALHTTLFTGATAGANTITLAPLNGAAANPAAAALPAGTVLTVGYGTAAAENVTVLSVAATAAGYASVVVTLTANLAANHSSGVTVCQPLPAGVTLPTGANYPAYLDAGATLTATGGPRAAY